MTDEPDRIYVSDAREMGICALGQRRFFKAHGLDFRKFLREGIAITEIEAIDDAYCKRVIEHVRSK